MVGFFTITGIISITALALIGYFDDTEDEASFVISFLAFATFIMPIQFVNLWIESLSEFSPVDEVGFFLGSVLFVASSLVLTFGVTAGGHLTRSVVDDIRNQ